MIYIDDWITGIYHQFALLVKLPLSLFHQCPSQVPLPTVGNPPASGSCGTRPPTNAILIIFDQSSLITYC